MGFDSFLAWQDRKPPSWSNLFKVCTANRKFFGFSICALNTRKFHFLLEGRLTFLTQDIVFLKLDLAAAMITWFIEISLYQLRYILG